MDKIIDFDVVIIGGGPGGIMAAIRAGERNKKVLLIERNALLGKKLLISGKGRCNLTNSGSLDSFLDKFSESGDFLRNAFSRFFNGDLIDFFERSGVRLKTERGGRVFPVSDKSYDILRALEKKLKSGRVTVLLGERVKEVDFRDNAPARVSTFSNKCFSANNVAICCGGLAYPSSGSTGDGYELAKKLGHAIVPIKPALVPVKIKERFIKDWQGISLENVKLTLFADNKNILEKFGDMIFTHFGISGPIVLDMSADIFDALKKFKDIAVSVNFKPALDYAKLDARLMREFNGNPKKGIANVMPNLLPKNLIGHFLEYCRILADKKTNQITAQERKTLINAFFDFRLTVAGTLGVEDGIVTRGGVSTKEINPKTMESRLVKGLFFAGEIIDIDAKTGGYNMQAAFSTGWVCGDNI